MILWGLLLVCIPLVINDLPEDFFSNPIYLEASVQDTRGFASLMNRLGRNLLGWFLILVVGPIGLSLISVLFGFILITFKGKMGIIRKLVNLRCVWFVLSYIRAKGGKPPLILPEPARQI